MRASTSASQARGSAPFILAVTIELWRVAAGPAAAVTRISLASRRGALMHLVGPPRASEVGRGMNGRTPAKAFVEGLLKPQNGKEETKQKTA